MALVFAALAGATLREWLTRRTVGAGWLCAAFVLIAAVALELAALSEDSEDTAIEWLRKLGIAGLALFPYLLYRFTTALKPASRRLDLAAAAAAAVVIVATLAIPGTGSGEDGAWYSAYVAAFLAMWTFLSMVVAVRLWRAGAGEPVLPRRRMQTLAVGAVGLSVALLFGPVEDLMVATRVIALVAAGVFFVAFVTPRLLRRPFRSHVEERFRTAVTALMAAATVAEVKETLLSNARELVGGRGAALLDEHGTVVGSHRLDPLTPPPPAAGDPGERHGGSGWSDAAPQGTSGAGVAEGADRPAGAATAAMSQPQVDGARPAAGEWVELRLDSYTLAVWTSPFTPIFGGREREALLSLGRLAEQALERSALHERERQAHEALRRQIDFSRMLVDSSVDGILAFDRNYRYTLWNQGMERITGVPRAEAIGRPAFDVFPFLREIGEQRFFDEALAGRDAISANRRFEVPDTGAEGFFEARYAPLYGVEGEVVGGLAIVRDVTDRKQAEHEREQRQREELARAAAEARNRMVEHLQAVTDVALGHLTLDDMVAELLERIRAMLEMDVAALALLEEQSDSLVVRAATGFQRAKAEGFRVPLGSGFFGRVGAERRPIAVERLNPSDMHTPILNEEGIRSVLGVPMLVGGRLVGALEVGRREPHSFSREDTTWLQLVADRVALAVEQAAIYEREHRIAETLQRSLLPENLPSLPGMEIAARYLAGGAGAVGGDWYDVIPLPRGRVGLAMGDVVGHGIGAASLMGQMRSALRAYALEDDDPASVLRRLDRLVQSMGPAGMATLLYAVLDPESSSLAFSSAGHPPPLVREPGHRVRYLWSGTSVPLGVQAAAQFERREFELPAGATLLFYTDGLVERRGATLDEGFERLRQAVAASPEAPEELCHRIVRELLPEDPDDDTALLVVQSVTAPVERLHLSPPAEPSALATVRGALRRWLDDLGLEEGEAYEVLVAVGEACANAVEHAYGPGEATFDLEAWVEEGTVAVSVRDRGQWREPRGHERGRGLQLMRELMDSTEVERGERGTTVRLARALAREVVA